VASDADVDRPPGARGHARQRPPSRGRISWDMDELDLTETRDVSRPDIALRARINLNDP